MKTQLQNYFNRHISLTEAQFEEVYSCFEIKTYQKKDLLLREGEVCQHKYFIIDGLIRSYYIDDKGTEKITQFAIENWWVTNTESFALQRPSNINLQAVEETTVLRIKKDDLDVLLVEIPALEKFFRIVAENMVIAIQRRYGFYMKMNSKIRYEHFVEWIPDFAQRVPLYMIASYLDITPEYLSQLRKG
ncbi:Crp/Fnr family transcriptional regulator [Roseivirga sp. E12]|uniref:Crp/Fnr family transcriptional regulator n=1 Tax=Roseivirga sp. E12 TaxID=2819237 RepID=UPI001ABC0E1D|nr:Crp/Fnr family transcriptional regulator [Roseivirga sp. E12]MBO3697917.1 Crp/Fnr family transcriptional regulator [Roseivirga sp. E12]